MQRLVKELKRLQSERTKAGKQQILEDNTQTPYFKEANGFLLNKYDVVGLSTKKLSQDLPEHSEFQTFTELLEYLRANPTGSNDTVSKVKGFVNKYDAETADVLLELIAKTLTVGVSAKSANKAYGKGFIPVFDVQLAFPYEKKIGGYSNDELLYVTKKLDGHRCLTLVDVGNGNITITSYTRQGTPYDGLTEMHNHILEFIKQNPFVMVQFKQGMVFDGEILIKNDEGLSTVELFQATSKVLRKDGNKKGLQYHIFDMITLADFQYNDASERNYGYRRINWLDELRPTENISVVPVLDTITKKDIHIWSEYATEHEWEGVMLNSASGYYRKTRSTDLLKVKKMHTADLEIVGYNQAIDGLRKGGLQSLIVKLDDDNVVNVGSGIPGPTLTEIWENQDKYLGTMVEIQYFEETENEQGGRSLRFPVFKGFRHDKTPADANID